MISKGKVLRELTREESPLLMVGTINAMCAKLAAQAGHRAIYLSGAGVANADFALPDLGITSLDNVVEQARRITQAVDLPLLIDGDTGFGSVLNVKHSVRQFEFIGAAGVHFEDQEFPKRCGQRSGKKLCSINIMQDRIKAAVDARLDQDFVIMARTDAANVDGIDAAIDRALSYVQAGADMIFAEAVSTLGEYAKFCQALSSIPVLANITEFGVTPLFKVAELKTAGIKIVLYPLSAFRAMNYAAEQVYSVIKQKGTQGDSIKIMQTREQLYKLIDYYKYENEL